MTRPQDPAGRRALLDDLCDALDIVQEVAALFREVRDPSQHVRGYPDWTYADMAAHLFLMGDAQLGYIHGSPTPRLAVDDVAGSNAALLGEFPDRDLDTVVPAFVDQVGGVAATARRMPPDAVVRWHGRPAPLTGMLAMLVGELLIHGRDIARSLDCDWVIPREVAVAVVDADLALFPLLVDQRAAAGVTVSYDLRVRGGPTALLQFHEGHLTVRRDHVASAGSRRVDCHISADPVSFLLVAYRRSSVWREVALGRLGAWGRKPWLALELVSLLVAP